MRNDVFYCDLIHLAGVPPYFTRKITLVTSHVCSYTSIPFGIGEWYILNEKKLLTWEQICFFRIDRFSDRCSNSYYFIRVVFLESVYIDIK